MVPCRGIGPATVLGVGMLLVLVGSLLYPPASAQASTTSTVSGTLSGLDDGKSVVLRNAVTSEALTLTANGSYSFLTPQAIGAGYAIRVEAQPAGQTCAVSYGQGTIGSGNDSDVKVICGAELSWTFSYHWRAVTTVYKEPAPVLGTATDGGSWVFIDVSAFINPVQTNGNCFELKKAIDSFTDPFGTHFATLASTITMLWKSSKCRHRYVNVQLVSTVGTQALGEFVFELTNTAPVVLQTAYSVPAGQPTLIAQSAFSNDPDNDPLTTTVPPETATGPCGTLETVGQDVRFTPSTAGGTCAIPVQVTDTIESRSFNLTFTVPPQLSINDISVTEGNSGTTDAAFTVSLSAPAPTGGVQVDLATANGTATAGSDYVSTSGTVTIPEGEISATFTVPVNGDATWESDETFVVNLTNASNAVVQDQQGQGTIQNDDAAPDVTVVTSAGGVAVSEGTPNDSYTLKLTSEPTADVTITISAGSQVSVSPDSVTFTPTNWSVAQTVTVTATDDGVVEGPHTATIDQSVTSGDPNYDGLAMAALSVAITDNDSAVVNFAPAAVSQAEGTSPMVFTVTLSNPVSSGVNLTLNSANDGATAADYTPVSGATVSFPAGSTTAQEVSVDIANDALDEDDETFTLMLSDLTATGNVSLGTAVATGTILDDDATPTLGITSPGQDEGNAGQSPMNFVVSLSAVSGRNVSFTRATADGTATVADNDYLAIPPGSVTIPAGQLSVTIPVTINGDTVPEGNETFSVNLTGITNATPGSLTGTGTLEEDDQQPTTTTITADLPGPSVVGQPYPVSVTVAAQTLSPTGSVTISDGTTSCGPVTLTAGSTPSSTASCKLTSTSTGAKTLTASYTADSLAFGDSIGTATHQVNPASTTISVSGPPTSRINQPTSFSFALGVDAPGAGTPSGTVTLSSGASSCTATLPETSCTLTFSALGSRTVSASYSGDGNFNGAASDAGGHAQTRVYAESDLAITKSNGVSIYKPGDLLVYSVIVRNFGPDAAVNIGVTDLIPAGLVDVVWSCDASGDAACPSIGGARDLDVMVASLPVGGMLNFTSYGNVDGSPAIIANTASLTLPADSTIEDPVGDNNSATDIDRLERLFADGFEDARVNGPAGSNRVPALVLANTLGDEASIVLRLSDARGEAVRVYARLHGNAIQYALASRAASGKLRPSRWLTLPGEPTLWWTARPDADGWGLQTAELR